MNQLGFELSSTRSIFISNSAIPIKNRRPIRIRIKHIIKMSEYPFTNYIIHYTILINICKRSCMSL